MTTTIIKRNLHWVFRAGIISILVIALFSMEGYQYTAKANEIRGYLTSAADLAFIRQQAANGIEPFASLVDDFLSDADAPSAWLHGSIGGQFQMVNDDCVSDYSPDSKRAIEQQGGAQGVYEKMLAYHLTGNIEYAQVARDRLMDLTTTSFFGGPDYSGQNECLLVLALAMPLWIQAADLLEGIPVWSLDDKHKFQEWLSIEVYHKVAWASRVRRNNWGSAGSVSASVIADYLMNSSLILVELDPVYLELTPAQAYQQHNGMQLSRMNTVWKGDSRCEIWGIQAYGGMPDELRRGSTGCNGQWLLDNDSSYNYQVAQIDHLVFHAEFLRRRGFNGFYDNVDGAGAGSIHSAILFIIHNPINPSASITWGSYMIGILSVANYTYQDTIIAENIALSSSVQRGGMVAYGQLTHTGIIEETVSDVPSDTPVPTDELMPTNTPVPTDELVPTSTPLSTNTPMPTSTPIPTNTPMPTSTPLSTNTPMPTNTPVPLPTQAGIFVASLTSVTDKQGSSWTMHVTVNVTDTQGIPIVGANVAATFSPINLATSCVTDANGQCDLLSDSVSANGKDGIRDMILAINMISAPNGVAYAPNLNAQSSISGSFNSK